MAIDKEKDSRSDREYFKFIESPTRPGFPVPEVHDAETADIIENRLSKGQALQLVSNSGLAGSDAFDQIVGQEITEDQYLLEYDLNGICQFQVELVTEGEANFTITRRVCEFDMLQEDGFVILKEDGDALRTEGLVP